MTVERLRPRPIGKIWGRRDMPPPFGPIPPDAEPVGEIWFESGQPDDALLVKYLFTSEKLSVQVHPDDAAARRRGLPGGKEEAWWILSAEPDARIGLGLREETGRDVLRAAALDGSIEELLDWQPVAAGDCIYSPPGTIHAIGAGLSLIEVQQNADVTYRLFDYGRDRELHLDAAVEVAAPLPYRPAVEPEKLGEGRTALIHGRAFVLERWTGARSGTLRADAPAWLVPLAGAGTAGGEPLAPGGVWRVEGDEALELGAEADLLVAYEGGEVRPGLLGG